MTREEALKTVYRIVCEDRNGQYGEPEDSFTPIAEFWTTYLRAAHCCGITLTSTDVAMMLALMKVGRYATATTPKLDTLLDLIGYATCAVETAFKPSEKR